MKIGKVKKVAVACHKCNRIIPPGVNIYFSEQHGVLCPSCAHILGPRGIAYRLLKKEGIMDRKGRIDYKRLKLRGGEL